MSVSHLRGVRHGKGCAAFCVDTTGVSNSILLGGETTFIVTFSRTAIGIRAANLRVTNDDPDGGTFEVGLLGANYSQTITPNGAGSETVAIRLIDTQASGRFIRMRVSL